MTAMRSMISRHGWPVIPAKAGIQTLLKQPAGQFQLSGPPYRNGQYVPTLYLRRNGTPSRGRRLLWSWVMILLLSSSLRAEFFVGEGATGATFLKIPTSARAAGLGGAFSSVSGDVSAIEYNPAGLSNLQRTDFQAAYLDYIEDTSLQAFSVGFPINLRSGSVQPENEANVFNQNKMQFGLQYKVFRAEDTERTALGVKGDTFDIRDQVVDVALAYPLSRHAALGIAGKFIGQTLEDESANNYAFDAGIQYKWEGGWSLGASVQNLGSSKAFIEEKDPLPTLARLGINREWKRFMILAEGTEGRDKIHTGALAAEWGISDYVKFRGGVIHDTTLEFSGGLGIQFDGPQKAPVISAPRKSVYIGEAEQKTLGRLGNSREYAEKDDSKISITLNRLVKKLIGQYKTLEQTIEKPSLAIFPLKSDVQNVGLTFSDLLTHQFVQTREFTVIERASLIEILEEQKLQLSGAINPENAVKVGKILASNLILIGSIEKIDNTYLINSRLVEVEGGKVLATAYEELSSEAFREVANPRQRISEQTKPSGMTTQVFPNISIGLDYGLATHKDLGITHTVSLRILY